MTFSIARCSILRMIRDNLFSEGAGKGNISSDEEVERIMLAFNPTLKSTLEQRHPEWRPLVEKAKQATGLLKNHEIQADWNSLPLVEYADWCFYPEPDGTFLYLAVYADLIVPRTEQEQQRQDKLFRELEAIIQPNLYTLRQRGNDLIILLRLTSSPPR